MIKILDCTLRDGGYVNNWMFGETNIKTIISKVSKSNIEIVECGFLSTKDKWEKDQSKYNSIEEMEEHIVNKYKDTMYVGLINFGEFEIDNIPNYKDGLISGIRVAFHMDKIEKAIDYCNEIIKKGYKVFIQPMVTINYTDKQLLELVEKANEIKPYAFYIVDSFGVMKQNDLTRMFYLLDNNLDENICIGYHAHNNLQLAYSNAQSLVNISTSRCRIIDCSVLGMGRGAGNLNTELFTSYLNLGFGKSYIIENLLEIIDDILNSIYAENYWGYSLAHYLSATFNCHPNYASYLSDRNVLTVKEISDILKMISKEKKSNFDKLYIDELYNEYQSNSINDLVDMEILKKEIQEKEILVLAPGKKLMEYCNEVKEYIDKNDVIVVGTNFIPQDIDTDYIFVSNIKRYHNIYKSNKVKNINDKLITTSNIKVNNNSRLVVNYTSLLNEFNNVEDNSGLMIIKLLVRCGVNQITLAGFDGYSYEYEKNYACNDLKIIMKQKSIKELNENIKLAIEYFANDVNIKFITPSKYTINKDIELVY